MKNPSGDGRDPTRRTLTGGAACSGQRHRPMPRARNNRSGGADEARPSRRRLQHPLHPGRSGALLSGWPIPVPGREWIKKNGITFTNHQAASCVCSPARSTIYTGQHIQHTGIFDNAGSLWQPDMSTDVRTIGHRMAGARLSRGLPGQVAPELQSRPGEESDRRADRDYRKIMRATASTISSASATSSTPRSAAIITTTRPRRSYALAAHAG